MANKKLKLLYLARYLREETDERHPRTVQDMIAYLERQGISAERKSIYDDLELLELYGMDVQAVRGKTYGYFLGEREFQLPELKLLIDVVQASPFLTQSKSMELIAKLEQLTSRPNARQLRRQVYVMDRVRTHNEKLYYAIDGLNTAINDDRKVTFRYFDWTPDGGKAYRRGGTPYETNPVALCVDKHYYLVAYDISNQEMRHYRVDKMAEIVVTGLPREGEDRYPDFDVAAYGQKHFGMYSGEEASVTLRCRSHMAGVVWDRFGQDVILVPEDEDHFTVTLPLVLSPQFFGWLFGLEDNVELIAPQKAAEEYRRKLKAVLEQYG